MSMGEGPFAGAFAALSDEVVPQRMVGGVARIVGCALQADEQQLHELQTLVLAKQRHGLAPRRRVRRFPEPTKPI